MTQLTGGVRTIEVDVKRRLTRYRADVESWKSDHLASRDDLWVIEDFVANANFLLGRLLALDSHIQRLYLTDQLEFNPTVEAEIEATLKAWLDVSLGLLPTIDRLESLGQGIKGGDEFRANVRQVQAILTPDDEFFAGEKLDQLAQEAIADHRAGKTEPYDVVEPGQ